MNSTSPFAGTAVPAEGVSLWLGEFLRSPNLEQGLVKLLALLEGDSRGPLAVWVWPEPSMVAVGVVGTSRFYDVRQREFDGDAVDVNDLAVWSFPDADPREAEVRLLPIASLPSDDGHDCESPSTVSPCGALCWIGSERPAPRDDELAWLGTLLGWLAARERQLRDAKLRSLAEFAAGAGHEINNPLGTILGRSQLLLRQEVDPERRRWLTSIGGQALRIRDMISDTMVFARPPAPKSQLVEIEPLIRAVTDRFAEELTRARVDLQIEIQPDNHSPSSTLSASVDSEQFQVVCIELLRNVTRAVGLRAESGGRIGLRARLRTWQGRRWLEVDLCNNGPELTAVERTHAFDPFFSGRDAGRGLGFGLTKCWRIVTGHGGQIGVHSTPARTVFRTLWPLD
ncbi:MAG: HAMP domain-containing sensor histidine kinase [Planctomycetaceae bacterium]